MLKNKLWHFPPLFCLFFSTKFPSFSPLYWKPSCTIVPAVSPITVPHHKTPLLSSSTTFHILSTLKLFMPTWDTENECTEDLVLLCCRWLKSKKASKLGNPSDQEEELQVWVVCWLTEQQGCILVYYWASCPHHRLKHTFTNLALHIFIVFLAFYLWPATYNIIFRYIVQPPVCAWSLAIRDLRPVVNNPLCLPKPTLLL